MTTMHHDGSNALTVQFAFAFLWFYSVLPCHLPSVRFFFYQRLQLCAHLMMSENHKRRQLGDTKKKEQRWLDGNGKGKKKIGSSSAINLISLLHTERASVHSRWTEAGRANDFVFLNYSKSQQDVVITFSRAWNRASNSTMPCEEFEFFSDRFSFLLFFVLFFGKEGRKKKSLNEGDFLSFGYSWENEIKMCWWISYDEGVYCLAKHQLFSPPPIYGFFSSFSLAVTGCCLYKWLLCAGEVDRRLWLSFPHYFVGQNESCLIFSFVSQFHFDAQTFEVCVVMSSSNRGPPSTTTQVFFSHFCCWFVCFSFSLRTLCVS